MKTRRQFVKTSIMGVAATWTLPAFLDRTIWCLDAHAADSAVQVTTGRDGPILVVLQLSGGNDGLNTVIPFADDSYYRVRGSLAIDAGQVLKASDDLGFHPSLAALHRVFEEGYLSVLNGVGYPNPNRSHFRSMEIWHTASDADQREAYGWLGRYFDNNCAGEDPVAGIHVGKGTPQALHARTPRSISLSHPAQYQPLPPGGGQSKKTAEFYRLLNRPDEPDLSMARDGGSIGELGGVSGSDDEGNLLDFLQRVALDTQLSSDQIRRMVSSSSNTVSYPDGSLAQKLKLISQLIGGGMKTRIYYVSQGGYDTHANQAPAHARLLDELGSSLAAFLDDLKAQGNLDRTLVITFSEFGRRVAPNASGGTDHGAAGPMFLAGGKVKAGFQGDYPSLTQLDRGDLRHSIDFRSVYATILHTWLKVDPLPILGRQFPLYPQWFSI